MKKIWIKLIDDLPPWDGKRSPFGLSDPEPMSGEWVNVNEIPMDSDDDSGPGNGC